MAADSRYMYHHSPHQTLATPQYNYQYQSPPVSYNNESSVSRRTQQQQASPHPHSPVQYHHSQPPPPPPPAQPGAYSSYSSYQQAPPTATPPPQQQQQQQQWSNVNETWPPQYGYPPSISPESTYNNRPEPSTTSYESHQPPPPSNSMNGTTATTKYRHRLPEELESPPSYSNSQPSSPNSYAHTAIDFDQLMKQIKFVENPLRETLAGSNSSYKSAFPGPDTLEQMMNAATYAAQILDSAAGTASFSTSAMSTSPSPMDSVSYAQPSSSNSMDTSHHHHHHQGGAGYPSPPTSREAGTQSPHHPVDNSPPLSASIKRRHTGSSGTNNGELENSPPSYPHTHPHGHSHALSGPSSGSQPPPPSAGLHQQQQQQQQSYPHHHSHSGHSGQPLGSGPGSGSASGGPPAIAHSSSNSTNGNHMSPSMQPAQTVPATEGQGQTCLGCSATSTPEWRRGPLGPRTLCNACGLVYAKLIKKRDRERARNNATGKMNTDGGGGNAGANNNDGTGPGAGGKNARSGGHQGGGNGNAESISGDSEEDEIEDDYGSGTSGRRSDFDDYRGRD